MYKSIPFIPLSVRIIFYIPIIIAFIIPVNLFGIDLESFNKVLFLGFILVAYLLLCNKILIKEIIFIFFLFLAIILTGNINLIHMLSIIVLFKSLKYEKEFIYLLKNSKIIWISLAFSIIYCMLFLGDGRLVHTAIYEVNQSALSCLYLGLLLRKKNKYFSYFTFILGFFTFSRAYLLSIIILLFSNLKIVKRYCINKKIINYSSFFVLLIVSSLILIFFAYFYEFLYAENLLYTYKTGFSRIFSFLDLSNYFRFITNKNLLLIFIEHPNLFLKGLTEEQFYIYSYDIAIRSGQLYRYTNPHNFFFSYLKIYGAFSFVIFYYISLLLKKIVNKNNFGVYISLVLYAIFLSVGFNNYWLYLTFFVILLYKDNDLERDLSNA